MFWFFYSITCLQNIFSHSLVCNVLNRKGKTLTFSGKFKSSCDFSQAVRFELKDLTSSNHLNWTYSIWDSSEYDTPGSENVLLDSATMESFPPIKKTKQNKTLACPRDPFYSSICFIYCVHRNFYLGKKLTLTSTPHHNK